MTETATAASETGKNWSTWGQALRAVIAAKSLTRSASVALIVGSAFFAMNQLGSVLAGRANALLWVKVALTYLTPLVVSNIGMLSATRQPRPPRHISKGQAQ
jgi:hypothetical protein